VERDRCWDIYGEVMRQARERGISFAVGGGIAVATYVPSRIVTKDVDLYVKPSDRDEMIGIVSGMGLRDYFEKSPYQRHWIHRRYCDDTIVDIMWGMPNHRAVVDDGWLENGREVEMCGERFRVLPPEELIWAKIYVLQRDRTDWPDILNIMYAAMPELDWDRLIERAGTDAPLLEALLSIFRWLSPSRAAMVPKWVERKLKTAARGPGSGIPHDDLLDTRPWFLPRVERELEKEAC
jgi:hypothetical protein